MPFCGLPLQGYPVLGWASVHVPHHCEYEQGVYPVSIEVYQAKKQDNRAGLQVRHSALFFWIHRAVFQDLQSSDAEAAPQGWQGSFEGPDRELQRVKINFFEFRFDWWDPGQLQDQCSAVDEDSISAHQGQKVHQVNLRFLISGRKRQAAHLLHQILSHWIGGVDPDSSENLRRDPTQDKVLRYPEQRIKLLLLVLSNQPTFCHRVIAGARVQ